MAPAEEDSNPLLGAWAHVLSLLLSILWNFGRSAEVNFAHSIFLIRIPILVISF